jgi:pyridoxine 5-phosphate synthase
MRLYVNIDHIATVRQARRTDEPDPVRAAVLVELAGADGITVHLREDRRHIQDRDVELLMRTARTPVNLEVAASSQVLDQACAWRPFQVTLVPERREEVTTEGGLALHEAARREATRAAIARLRDVGIRTSLFIDPAVHAGHGLTYENVVPIAAIDALEELNIGHSIVSRAVFTGLEAAVREMGELLRRARAR